MTVGELYAESSTFSLLHIVATQKLNLFCTIILRGAGFCIALQPRGSFCIGLALLANSLRLLISPLHMLEVQDMSLVLEYMPLPVLNDRY